jgi:cbb3-type cytochrome oxidase subunit 3
MWAIWIDLLLIAAVFLAIRPYNRRQFDNRQSNAV